MADPRLFLAFEGIGAEYATFKYDGTIVYSSSVAGGSASVGLAVMMTGNGQVGLTSDAAAIVGRLESVESDGFCRVQTEGFARLPTGNAATTTAGKTAVGALGAAAARGYIRDAASAADALVAGDNFIIDATDATSVVVEL